MIESDQRPRARLRRDRSGGAGGWAFRGRRQPGHGALGAFGLVSAPAASSAMPYARRCIFTSRSPR